MKKLCMVVLLAMPMVAFGAKNDGVWLKCVINNVDFEKLAWNPKPNNTIGQEFYYLIRDRTVFTYKKESKTLNKDDSYKFSDEKIGYSFSDSYGDFHFFIDRRTLGLDIYRLVSGSSIERATGQCGKIEPLPVISNQL